MAGINSAINKKYNLDTVNAFIFLEKIEYLLSKHITGGACTGKCLRVK